MRCAPHKPPLLYTGEAYSRFAPVCTDMWVPSDDGRLNRLSQTGLTLTPSAQWANNGEKRTTHQICLLHLSGTSFSSLSFPLSIAFSCTCSGDQLIGCEYEYVGVILG